MTLQFDFTYWTVIESVADDVDVYLRGDVEYRLSDSEGYATLEDVPLLVGFNAVAGVHLSSFHGSQNADVADTIMLRVAEGLTPVCKEKLSGMTLCSLYFGETYDVDVDGTWMLGVFYTSKYQDVFQQVRRNTVDVLLVVDDSFRWRKSRTSWQTTFSPSFQL